MKIKYSNGYFHGYQGDGEPCFTHEEFAASFESKESALLQISHDLSQWGMDGGPFELVNK